MFNKDVYAKNPAENVIANNGVVNVTDDQTEAALRVLRYELETFICEGQYEKGLEKILDTFLKSLSSPEQPGIWISGFFGSGKSHLAKMLKALWIDFAFPDDQATARSLARLPLPIIDLFRELSTEGKRYGGLHAASGTLGAGAGENVRLALLGIIFKSVGLPEQYHIAKFEMRLKEVGILNAVKTHIENAGKVWTKERDHIYNSPLIIEAIVNSWPEFADTPAQAREQLKAQYTKVEDVTNDEMVNAIRDAIAVDGKFPLTVIVLDEIQQYIGNSSDRAYKIQEVAEACCKKFGGKLLFVATGQTALSGTSMLQKLMGRFQVPVPLSDTDVDSVIRKIILAKRAACVPDIEQIMSANLGEISRHLSGSKIEHRNEDNNVFIQDYPILPVRRRFWDKVLRMVDATGTISQLRNQLKIVHESTIATLEKPLGSVVPGDFIYGQLASGLLQTGVMSKDVYEQLQRLSGGTEDDQLKARIAALIFLIGKLPRDAIADTGVRANPEMLSDLLVEDITVGSAELRKRIPALLKELEDSGLVMAINDEYHLQTPESSAWHDEYRKQLAELSSNPTRVDQERATLLRKSLAETLKGVRPTQGVSKEARAVTLSFDADLPADALKKVYAWIRDGWQADEKSVIADARNAGNLSPTIFVYIPRHAADEISKTIISFMASQATLDARGVPNTPEGQDARSAMQTRFSDAVKRLDSLIKETFDNIRVFQGGGNEIIENSLAEQITVGVNNSLIRLYPQFDVADHPQWAKVYEQAKKGAGDALRAVGHSEEASKHPVCAALLRQIAGGKKGSEIRETFKDPPYGWPQDAIDGGLYALLAGGGIRATDSNNKSVDVKSLDRAKITQTTFKVESVTITTVQFIQVRKLFQDAGISCKPGEELNTIPAFLQESLKRAEAAGGEPPKPDRPGVKHIEALKSLLGNEQILALFNQREELSRQIQEWETLAKKIEERMVDWVTLESLLGLTKELGPAESIRQEANAIKTNRLLITEPNLMDILNDQATQLLRKALNSAREKFSEVYYSLMAALEKDTNWQALSNTQRKELLDNQDIAEIPAIATGTVDEIIESLEKISLKTWYYRREALPGIFEQVRLAAAKLLEPKVTQVTLPKRTLKTEDDARDWLKDVETLLLKKVKDGPIIV